MCTSVQRLNTHIKVCRNSGLEACSPTLSTNPKIKSKP
uniref:Uncharacterized protein n=1 Tax=Anguilla anguilla TaxID=7936 RepID=A0A0E9V5U4_ANGAN